MRKTRLSTAVVLGVAAVMTPLAALAGPASAATSSTNPNTPEKVASGINAAQLPGATVFGTTPADTPETVSFILQERNYSLLQANVINGVTKYLSVSQFASTYGQTPANIAALTSYLAGFGIKTDVYANNVDVSATGTAGEFDAALSVTQNQYHVPAIRGAGGLGGPTRTDRARHRSGAAAAVPALELRAGHPRPYQLRSLCQQHGAREHQRGQAAARSARAPAEKLVGLPSACNLPSDFASRYGLDGLYSKGANGSGTTLAIVTLAAVDPGAPQYFWSNIAHIPNTGRTFTVQNIDGGPGAPSDASGTGETDLDLEQSGSLAPGANVIDYQAPNTDYGFADAFFTAASQNTADTVSTSWGVSETALVASILAGQEAATYNAGVRRGLPRAGRAGTVRLRRLR